MRLFSAGLLLAFATIPSPVRAQEPRPEIVFQLPHWHVILELVYSHDGAYLASASQDGTVKVWEAKTGRVLRSFYGYGPVDFTVDGSALLYNQRPGLFGEVRLGGPPRNDAPSAEAAPSADPKGIRVVDLRTGGLRTSLPVSGSIAVSPRGDTIAVATRAGNVELFDARTGNKKRVIGDLATYQPTVKFSPNGEILATGDKQGSLVFIDPATGSILRRAPGHRHVIASLAFSPDGRRVASGSVDTTIRIWDVRSGETLKVMSGHPGQVTNIAFSRDGATLVSSSGSNSRGGDLRAQTNRACIKLWDAESGAERKTFIADNSYIIFFEPPVCCSPTEDTFVFSYRSSHNIELRRVEDAKFLRNIRGSVATFTGARFLPESKAIATTSSDGLTRIWSLESGRLVESFQPQSFVSPTLAVSDDSRQIATAGQGSVLLWRRGADTPQLTMTRPDLAGLSGQELQSQLLQKNVTSLAFQPHGRLLAAAYWDHLVLLWDTTDGHLVREVARGQELGAGCIAFSPDGSLLVGGGYPPHNVQIWDAATGDRKGDLSGARETVKDIAFSRDGRFIVVASDDGMTHGGDTKPDRIVRVWPAQVGSAPLSFTGLEDTAGAVAFFPEGKKFAAADITGKIAIYQGDRSDPIRVMTGHSSTIAMLDVSADGKTLMSCGRDGTVRLWNSETGENSASLLTAGRGGEIVVSHPWYSGAGASLQAIAYRIGANLYAADQFDLKFNRPDLILKTLGGSPELVESYHAAYRKRLQRMRFTEEMLGGDIHLSEIRLQRNDLPVTTPLRLLPFTVKATDDKYRLDRLNVYVNDVPVYGSAGIDLRLQKTSSVEKALEVELTPGRNRVQVSVLNEKGAESLRETFEVTCTAPATKRDLYVVAVGVSRYANPAFNLTYPAKDAEDVAAYFESRRDAYGAVHVLKLVDGQATRAGVRRAKEFLMKSRPGDQAVVFCAGHGFLDKSYDYFFATSNVELARPSETALPYAELEDLLDGIPAREKLLLMDTCHAGEVDRETVITSSTSLPTTVNDDARAVKTRDLVALSNNRKPVLGLGNTFELMQELFADLERGSGARVIASSGGAEVSFESPEWHNGVFTYALLEGLKSGKADRSKDGRITVSELRAYVAQRVQALTSGKQKPTARREDAEFDFVVSAFP